MPHHHLALALFIYAFGSVAAFTPYARPLYVSPREATTVMAAESMDRRAMLSALALSTGSFATPVYALRSVTRNYFHKHVIDFFSCGGGGCCSGDISVGHS